MIYRGRISRIVGEEIYVQISTLAVDQDFGPMEFISIAPYAVDDYVLINQIEGAAEDLVIIGLIRDSLQQMIPGMPLPNAADSFFTGNADGTYQWKNKTQAKASLDIDDLETEVQPVNRGGTGITLWTTGNFVRASGATSLEQRTPSQVKSDIGLGNVDNTSDINKPVSTATSAAISSAVSTGIAGKRALYATIPAGVDFNTLTTPGEYAFSASPIVASTNTPIAEPGMLIVDATSSGSVVTQVYRTGTTNNTYTRSYYSAAWSSWTRFGTVNTTWTNITFTNTDFHAYGSGYRVPQYKVVDGTVHLRGLVTSDTATTTLTVMHSFASVGLQPGAPEVFIVSSSTTGPTGAASTGTAHTHPYSSGSGYARVDILLNGDLRLAMDGGRSLVAGGFFSLSRISWDVA